MTLLVLNTVYVLYWSQPFSRKRTGVKAVDQAVQRYRKPGEQVVGVIGGWCPDLVVDGTAYKFFGYYVDGTETGLLALDLHGRVVRDESLMNKLQVCMNFALGFVHPEHINTRTARYMAIKKAMDNLQQRWLARWEQLPCLQNIEEKHHQQFHALHQGLQFIHQDGLRHLALMETEAALGNQLGNTQTRSVDWEQTLQVEALWQERAQWSLQNLEIIRNGVTAARGLKRQLQRGTLALNEASRQEVQGMISVMLVQEEPDKLPMLEQWQAAGETTGRYAGLEADRMALWQSRLEWVKQVDGTAK